MFISECSIWCWIPHSVQDTYTLNGRSSLYGLIFYYNSANHEFFLIPLKFWELMDI